MEKNIEHKNAKKFLLISGTFGQCIYAISRLYEDYFSCYCRKHNCIIDGWRFMKCCNNKGIDWISDGCYERKVDENGFSKYVPCIYRDLEKF